MEGHLLQKFFNAFSLASIILFGLYGHVETTSIYTSEYPTMTEMNTYQTDSYEGVVYNLCQYNWAWFYPGATIPYICTNVTCDNGTWITNGYFNEDCGKCMVSDDPHFATFDHQYYSFHGICNYSIAQHHFNYSASFGIYGKFSPCEDVWDWSRLPSHRYRRHAMSAPSCSDVTTFTDHPHAVIKMHKLENSIIWINDQEVVLKPIPTTYNNALLAWTDGECITIVGSQGLMLKKCSSAIYVWAYPTLSETINGLCGHYNGTENGNFTDRDGNLHPLIDYPLDFPVSWMTSDQDSQCLETRRKRQIPAGPGGNPCTIPTEDIEERCNETFRGLANGNEAVDETVSNQIKSCISDICMMEMIGVDSAEIDGWFDEMTELVERSISIVKRTTPGAQPPAEEPVSHFEDADDSYGAINIQIRQEVVLN